MRDQAGIIQREVGLLLGDVGRLGERVTEIERHFGLSAKALEKLSASAEKISKRGQRLGSLEFDEDGEKAPPLPRLASST
jgi:DNA recombination protein RmuC